jgi:glucuronosyltransferase
VDESEHGVIFFSLGSLVRSDKISPEKLNAVLETFRALPQRVLWKWESDQLPNLPPNVMVRKWLPQNDILGDLRVKLFITHGGISSLEEAIYHRVPMVVIPLFSDQFFQARKIIHHGIGRKVDYETLTKETLLGTVQDVLRNSR